MKIIKTIAFVSSMLMFGTSFTPQGYASETKTAPVPASTIAIVNAAPKKVYGISVSPFVRKVRVVLLEKNLPYELEEILPTKLLKALNKDVPESFSKVSPLGKVPAYTEGDFAIADSAVIVDYLDRTNPNPPLYPKDAKDRARVEWFHKYADETVASVIIQKIFIEKIVKPQVLGQSTNEDVVQEAVQKELPPILDYLEHELGEKKWITGEDFTMADIALGSQFANLKIAGITIDGVKYPRLTAYLDRVHGRDSFKKTM